MVELLKDRDDLSIELVSYHTNNTSVKDAVFLVLQVKDDFFLGLQVKMLLGVTG